jgi:hypothetical protein
MDLEPESQALFGRMLSTTSTQSAERFAPAITENWDVNATQLRRSDDFVLRQKQLNQASARGKEQT